MPPPSHQSPTQSHRLLPAPRAPCAPLWRDLILRVWGEDPLRCPCCKATMRVADKMMRGAEIEFYLRLHGLWEGAIDIPPPPRPPFDIETLEPIHSMPMRWQPDPALAAEAGESPWLAPELPLADGRILVLDADPSPCHH